MEAPQSSSSDSLSKPSLLESCDILTPLDPSEKAEVPLKNIRLSHCIWPLLGLAAVALSLVLLTKELGGVSLDSVIESIQSLTLYNWIFAVGSTLLAYGALAVYDHIALMHLGKRLPWSAVTLTSFTAYALSHNIGMSMFSGAMIRWRAYGSMGLTLPEVGVFAALTSFTFALGVAAITGLLFIVSPESIAELFDFSVWHIRLLGLAAWSLILMYVIGSWRGFKPLKIGSFYLYYPSLPVVYRQLIIAPLEVLGAASIVYFSLPEAVSPGFVTVVFAFIASFSTALLSHAPGGLGVLEFTFIKIMPDVPTTDILGALLVFRLLYLIIPLLLGLMVVIIFEAGRLKSLIQKRR
jgi:uncharacterized membrane protein YbhN (UPF0104 family)